jgi:hypothetical protein
MTPFCVGERVTILSGDRRDQRGEVVRVQPVQVYQVRLGDGALLLYSQESLAREPAMRPPHLIPGRSEVRGQLV